MLCFFGFFLIYEEINQNDFIMTIENQYFYPVDITSENFKNNSKCFPGINIEILKI